MEKEKKVDIYYLCHDNNFVLRTTTINHF